VSEDHRGAGVRAHVRNDSVSAVANKIGGLAGGAAVPRTVAILAAPLERRAFAGPRIRRSSTPAGPGRLRHWETRQFSGSPGAQERLVRTGETCASRK
jgi:hypothetical protein